MPRLDRDKVVAEALRMLDEVGLDGISTRRLAQRLGVEQPALYWHFRSKAALLAAMAEAAMRPHAQHGLPAPHDDWRAWFIGNMRSFRHTLLMHRDGARLHAGSRPRSEDAKRVEHKIAFLVASGFTERDVAMALLGAGRFTLGCVLEQQADGGNAGSPGRQEADDGSGRPVPDHLAAFEAGLDMLTQGLACRRAERG